MKKSMLFLLLGFSVSLVACNTAAAPESPTRTLQSWTPAELGKVLDLSELGKVEYTKDGVTIGDKLLPSQTGAWANAGYGRTFNYLRLSEDTLNSLSISSRDFFLGASPDELRNTLKEINVSIATIRHLQDSTFDNSISLQAFKNNIYSAAKSKGKLNLFDVSRLNQTEDFGLSTQATYGITGRTTVDAFPGDCNLGSGGYRVRSVSSTTSNMVSNYIEAKTTLVIGGVTRSDSSSTVRRGVSSVVDSFNYTHPCQKIAERVSATGYHKGRQTSTSTSITKSSSW